jgi:hypothetical protein
MKRFLLAALFLAACVEGVECERKYVPKPSHSTPPPPPPPDAAPDVAEDSGQDSAQDH